jgi:hypothetical protein
LSLRVEVEEVRVGGRCFVRVGDTVHVRPSKPGKRDGFDARVTRIFRVGEETQVEVFGGRIDSRGRQVGAGMRTFTLDRIVRRRQTKNGEEIDRKKAG